MRCLLHMAADWQWLQRKIEELRLASTSRDVSLIHSHLRSVVPEFKNDKIGNPEKHSSYANLRVIDQL